MSNIFKTPTEVLQDMCDDYKTVTGVALSPTDIKREEIIKMFPFAGAISMLRSRLRQSDDDHFPASASEQALEKHLAARQMASRIQAQSSTGTIQFTGTNGTAILTTAQIRRKLDGSLYSPVAGGVIASGVANILYESNDEGANTNLDQLNQDFELVVPIPNITTACTNITTFANGRDIETPQEMLARIEDHDQNNTSGGGLNDYEQWARAASPNVVTTTPIKNARGSGTVNTIITAGTTDIAGAVANGDPVERIPGADLIATVQAYILAQNPTTDDHQTIAPTESFFNATVTYSLADESLRTQTDAQIMNIVKTFIYSALPGQTIFPTQLERNIDAALGFLITDRRVSDFSGGGPTFTLGIGQLLKPGTITLASF